MAPGWLTACAAEVPAADGWLGPRERDVLAGLRVDKRRSDWRLGRWAAKRAVAGWCGAAAGDVEILAAADGAPEAWLRGERLALSVSLSHRAGRALAVVCDEPAAVGCDLELIEPRSPAFVREWLAPGEQALLAGRPAGERARLANLLWTAKEAAAKLRRGGLRLDVRHAQVELAPGEDGWSALRVRWPDAEPVTGWWREDAGWVMAVTGAPSPARPVVLHGDRAAR